MAYCGGALDAATKAKKIAANPVTLVTPPRIVRKELQFLTLEQINSTDQKTAANEKKECDRKLAADKYSTQAAVRSTCCRRPAFAS